MSGQMELKRTLYDAPISAWSASNAFKPMARPMIAVPYVVAMIAVIVAVDVLTFRGYFLGTADGEHRNRSGVCSLLLAIP